MLILTQQLEEGLSFTLFFYALQAAQHIATSSHCEAGVPVRKKQPKKKKKKSKTHIHQDSRPDPACWKS